MVGTMNDVRAHAERLLREPVRLADLALAFDETVASTVDVQVEGPTPVQRDSGDVLAGTCNLEARSLKRFFEIDLLVRSSDFAALFDERFSTPVAASTRGEALTGFPGDSRPLPSRRSRRFSEW
jgi:hypothetical protein